MSVQATISESHTQDGGQDLITEHGGVLLSADTVRLVINVITKYDKDAAAHSHCCRRGLVAIHTDRRAVSVKCTAP